MLAFAIGLSACTESDKIPPGVPAVEQFRFGPRINEDAAMIPGQKAVWVAAVTRNYVDPREEHVPAKTAWIPQSSSCSPPRPQPGTRVTFVHTDITRGATPVFTMTRVQIAERAQEYVVRWRAKGGDPGFQTATSTDRFSPGNVFITDKSAPHYLVLSSQERVLWNIVLAEGVRVEAILLLAPGGGGVYNLPPGARISALGDAGMKSCRLSPMMPDSTTSGTSRRAREGDDIAQGALASRRQHFVRFADWFRASFGVLVTENAIGGERIQNALIGPVPDPAARLAYKSMKGSDLHLTPADYFVFGSLDTYRAKSMELIDPIARKLAGGDLKTLARK